MDGVERSAKSVKFTGVPEGTVPRDPKAPSRVLPSLASFHHHIQSDESEAAHDNDAFATNFFSQFGGAPADVAADPTPPKPAVAAPHVGMDSEAAGAGDPTPPKPKKKGI